ncbi:MAG: hypothetical protein Q9190_001204 [Brigantiaea leucoxantha]
MNAGTESPQSGILKPLQTKALTIPDVSIDDKQRFRSRLKRITVLLEAPFDPIRRQMNSVLLTIDLTKAVADEAIERKDCVVYSPHTAVDAAPGGLADWLADIVTGHLPEPEPAAHTAEPDKRRDGDDGEDSFGSAPTGVVETPKHRPRIPLQRTYSRPTYPSKPTADMEEMELKPSTTDHTRTVIHPVTHVEGLSKSLICEFPTLKKGTGFEKAGMGRLVTFAHSQPFTYLIERIARGVGSPKGFPVAIPQTKQVEDIQIRTVGICAGSGHSVLKDVDADLLFTGELSHHDALAATEKGKCVVTLFHSNTERGFLSTVLKNKLTNVLKDEWKRMRDEVATSGDLSPEWEDAVRDEDVLVECSEVDRDPFGVVILESSKQEGKPLS